MSTTTEALNSLGFDTGKDGSLTRFATAAFQREAGITVDGRVGPQTREAMASATDAQLRRGRLQSNIIRVGTVPFVQWFNTALRASAPSLYPHRLDEQGFDTVFLHMRELTLGHGLTPFEFVGLFCIFYNETGGTLRSLAELGGPAYCFGTNGGAKASYNSRANGNRKAGDQLLEAGAIGPEEVAQWNGTVWPDPPKDGPLWRAALECDFFKYRGHGLCQITWRAGHKLYVEPVLNVDIDTLSTQELDDSMTRDPECYSRAAALFFHDPSWAGPAFAATRSGNYNALGRKVSGSATYAMTFEKRCRVLLNAAAGRICGT